MGTSRRGGTPVENPALTRARIIQDQALAAALAGGAPPMSQDQITNYVRQTTGMGSRALGATAPPPNAQAIPEPTANWLGGAPAATDFLQNTEALRNNGQLYAGIPRGNQMEGRNLGSSLAATLDLILGQNGIVSRAGRSADDILAAITGTPSPDLSVRNAALAGQAQAEMARAAQATAESATRRNQVFMPMVQAPLGTNAQPAPTGPGIVPGVPYQATVGEPTGRYLPPSERPPTTITQPPVAVPPAETQSDLATAQIPTAALPARSVTGTIGAKAKGTGTVTTPPADTTKEVTTPGGTTDTGTAGGAAYSSANAAVSGQYGTHAPTEAQPSAFSTWSADELAQITQATVGQTMSPGEFDAWVSAFMVEHGNQPPWMVGPFDQANNLIDHLLALGESRRTAAMGTYGSTTDQTGNVMQDRGVTPDFWANAYSNRYSAPTYPQGMTGQPWDFDQYQNLNPGVVPNQAHPTALMLQNMGAPYSQTYPMMRRPYNPYYPAMSPGEWPPAPSGASANASASYLTPGYLYNY